MPHEATPGASPILIPVELFREVDRCLISMLKSLAPDDWLKPTVCSEWCVKDIAAHLLGGNLHRLSAGRDGYRAPPDGGGPPGEPLAAAVRRSNLAWTQALRELSPRLLIELLESSGRACADYFSGLDPFGPALRPVSWAGEVESQNWMDLAREYTEKWHHQRQIALAAGVDSGIETRRLYHPVLDAFMRALPFTFRGVDAADGVCIRAAVIGEAGGEWFLVRQTADWVLTCRAGAAPRASIEIPQDIAWRVFTKRWDWEKKLQIFPSIRFEGDVGLSRKVLEMVSIIA